MNRLHNIRISTSSTIFQMLCSWKLIDQYGFKNVCKVAAVLYSKRSDPNLVDSYKVVKSKKAVDDVHSNPLGTTPNWELLTPYGYRFFLPGSVGPAWQDASSIAQLANISLWKAPKEKPSKEIHKTFKFFSQDCPILLRKGVTELFNGLDFSETDLTIISLWCKTPTEYTEAGNEDVVKTFVLAAQEICARLRMAGYWADFINPFSGRPCLNPSAKMPLYETDERFRCLHFKVFQKAGCKVINTEKKQNKFIGSLFTTAPSDAVILNGVFSKYD